MGGVYKRGRRGLLMKDCNVECEQKNAKTVNVMVREEVQLFARGRGSGCGVGFGSNVFLGGGGTLDFRTKCPKNKYRNEENKRFINLFCKKAANNCIIDNVECDRESF